MYMFLELLKALTGQVSSGVATGDGGFGPPTSVQTPLGISANPLKSLFHI